MSDEQQLQLVPDDTPAPEPPARVTRKRRLSAPASTPPAPVAAALPVEPIGRAEPIDRPGRPLTDYGDVLTVEEAATVLRISRASAYQAARIWRATGTDGLPVIQIGRRLLVPRTALEQLLHGADGPDLSR